MGLRRAALVSFAGPERRSAETDIRCGGPPKAMKTRFGRTNGINVLGRVFNRADVLFSGFSGFRRQRAGFPSEEEDQPFLTCGAGW